MTCFKNPQNDYIECVSSMSWLYCLLFGLIYMAIKGLWTHIVVIAIIAIATSGAGALIAWLIYPFFIKSIIENKYRRAGWIEATKELK